MSYDSTSTTKQPWFTGTKYGCPKWNMQVKRYILFVKYEKRFPETYWGSADRKEGMDWLLPKILKLFPFTILAHEVRYELPNKRAIETGRWYFVHYLLSKSSFNRFHDLWSRRGHRRTYGQRGMREIYGRYDRYKHYLERAKDRPLPQWAVK